MENNVGRPLCWGLSAEYGEIESVRSFGHSLAISRQARAQAATAENESRLKVIRHGSFSQKVLSFAPPVLYT